MIQKGQKPLALEDYTDKVLADEMAKKLGPLDKSHPNYPKYFQAFKFSRLEQLEKMMSRDGKRKDKPKGSSSLEKEGAFKDLNPFTNKDKADWLILPRPQLTCQDFDLLSEGETQKVGQVSGLNLSTFDPKLVIAHRTWDPGNGMAEMPILYAKLSQALESYPLGIDVQLFLEKKLEKTLCYKPEFWTWNGRKYPTPDALAQGTKDIFWTQRFGPQELQFPTILEGQVCSPGQTLRRIWHHIQVLKALNINKEGGLTLKLDTLLEEEKRVFGIQFDPTLWLFKDVGDFVKTFQTQWK
jgi:hypothetical protein